MSQNAWPADRYRFRSSAPPNLAHHCRGTCNRGGRAVQPWDKLVASWRFPKPRYVAVGDADVAYQVVGTGPPDVLLCLGLGSHVEILWDHPVFANFVAGLASFGRVVLLDRRGTGASDGVPRNAIPTWEDWTEDFDAVLGAVGIERAALVARE